MKITELFSDSIESDSNNRDAKLEKKDIDISSY